MIEPMLLPAAGALIIFMCLVVYFLSGGADFGGGTWDLLARGPRAREQRDLIAHAIAPIWEANHVWLIAAMVFLFFGYPQAFAVLSVALHIPLTIFLFGIVFRGAAFVFRRYGKEDQNQSGARLWERVFAIASIISPFAIGLIGGAMVSGTIDADPLTGQVQTDFFRSWLAPFPITLGFFILSIHSFLAAVYLTNETDDAKLRDDFRGRALITGLVVAGLAGLCFGLSVKGASSMWLGVRQKVWAWPFLALAAGSLLTALIALHKRWFNMARIFAPLHIIFLMAGWGIVQFPYLVIPNLTVWNASAPDNVLRTLMLIFVGGGLLILPAFGGLYWVFKSHQLKFFSRHQK